MGKGNFFFDQYLRTTMIPTLEYRWEGSSLLYRYTEIVDGFDMPVRVLLNDASHWIYPNAQWKEYDFGNRPDRFQVDPNFYILAKPL